MISSFFHALALNWMVLLHPIHLSVTEFNYAEKDQALQITSRIFIDDLELAIRSRLKEPELDLLSPGNNRTTNQLVSEYLKDQLRIKIDGKPVKFNFLGSEREEPALVCYLEITGVKKLKTLEVMNSTIMDIHDDQSNLVHITYRSPVKSYRLTKSNPSSLYQFENQNK